MSLKILIFPMCIILSLVLVIGYIKPDVSGILEKRDEITKKTADLQKIDEVISNVRKLNVQINERKEGEGLVNRFLPKSIDEEHVLDAFNFLAYLSGVTITASEITENQPQDRPAPEVTHASISFQALNNGAPSDPNAPQPPTEKIRSFEASITAVGAYSSIKDFLARLYRADRLHELQSFVVSARENEKEETGVKYPEDFLKVTFIADFPYYSPSKLVDPLSVTVFQTDRFDFSSLEKMMALVNNPLPVLEAGQTGRPNPFQ